MAKGRRRLEWDIAAGLMSLTFNAWSSKGKTEPRDFLPPDLKEEVPAHKMMEVPSKEGIYILAHALKAKGVPESFPTSNN